MLFYYLFQDLNMLLFDNRFLNFVFLTLNLIFFISLLHYSPILRLSFIFFEFHNVILFCNCVFIWYLKTFEIISFHCSLSYPCLPFVCLLIVCPLLFSLSRIRTSFFLLFIISSLDPSLLYRKSFPTLFP